MDPYTGEILALANYPTFNPNVYRKLRRRRAPQPRHPGPLRAGLDIQDRDGVGGARAEACSSRRHDRRQSGGIIRFGSRVIRRHATTTACCRSPTSSSSRATSARSRSVCARRRAPRAVRAAASASAAARRPTFPARAPGIVWDPAKLTDSALASMAMGYQVGVTPLQMAAAVSSVANGGELVSRASCAR